MEGNEWTKFSATLVKVGNSYSLRVPMSIVKELKAEGGNLIVAKVKKLILNWSPEVMDIWFRISRECHELKRFSDEKLIFLSRLSFNEGKCLIHSVENKYEFDDKSKAAVKMSNALSDYRRKILDDYGKKVYDDYLYFNRTVQPLIEKKNKKK